MGVCVFESSPQALSEKLGRDACVQHPGHIITSTAPGDIIDTTPTIHHATRCHVGERLALELNGADTELAYSPSRYPHSAVRSWPSVWMMVNASPA